MGVQRPQGITLAQRIRALFSTGQQGAWYEKSDFSALFQDNRGSTPATTVEQPVGLMLDKRLGLVRGAELVTNGTMSGTTGWTAGSGATLSEVAGRLRVTNTATFGQAYQSFATVIGKPYVLAFDAYKGTSSTVRLEVGFAAADNNNFNFISTVDAIASTGFFVATHSTTFVTFRADSGYGEVDNISLKLLDGNHATQATAAARPTLSARVNLFLNSQWSGGGATPTGWVTQGAGATVAPNGTIDGNTVYRFNAAAVQHIFHQDGPTLGTSGSITASVRVGVVYSGSITIQNAILCITRPAGATLTYFLNGSLVAGSEAVTSNCTIATVVTSGGTAGPTGVRVGSGCGSPVTVDLDCSRPQLESGSTATTYQRVNTATDYDTAGFPYYEKFDGIDDSLSSTTGGGGTAGIFFCTAVKPTGGAGTNRTIWSDTGTNTGYRVRINAANQLELAASNGLPIATPVQAAATTSTTGGTGLAAATAYFYVITALNALGETLKSNEVSVTTGAGTTNSNTVNWAAITGATGYRIYRGTATGANNVYYAVGAVITYVDTGAASTAGSPPLLGETAYVKVASVATVGVGTTNVVTVWDDATNLNVQIGNGAVASLARPTVSAGTAGFTTGKDNGSATSFYTGNIYPEVYRKDSGLTAAERTTTKSYVASQAKVTL